MDGSSRTQVPLAAGEAMGLTLSAEGDIVTLSRDGQTMSLQVGQAVGGTTVVEGYLPLAYVAEQFGYGIVWEGQTGTVYLTAPAAQTVTRMPNLVYAELEDLMAQQAAKYRTKDNVVPMLWQGLLEMDITVGEETLQAAVETDGQSYD